MLGCQQLIWLGSITKLPVNNFEWIQDTSEFNKDFIEPYYEENDEGYFLNAYVQYPEILHKFHTIFT